MTDPLPASTTAKIAARAQAVRWTCTLLEVRQFRAFCCNIDSDGIMGVSKQPVTVLSLSPNPVCLGDAVDYDFAGSYAPGSAITSYAIDWGDLTIVDPAAASGNHTYAAAGSYTVRGTVTEGLGKTTTVEVEVNVIDCDDGLLIEWTYHASYGGGVYFRDWTADAPAWESRNVGLDLNVNGLAMRPGSRHKPDTTHELWAACDGGVYRTFDGGRHWAQLTLPDPSNDQADAPAPTVGDLAFQCVVFSKQTADLLWILAARAAPARLYVYRTDDDGLTWTSRGMVTT